ncbi:MAG TPA: creatininase family protein [Solirubrobacteraceae bacterium]|jgi:creatinine amidohydrolase|nr:creatininase family protein [Solirubrobacteraceae bacterium]
MPAVTLDTLTWPQVKAGIEAGRDTVVMALGATEQHGRHMPLATDALIGDHLAATVADRLDAFLAPTLRVGCSEHHVGFAGTLSVSEQSYYGIVGDLVRSLLRGGVRRIVLLPTHGGNFGPLAEAVARLDEAERAHVVALTDLGVLFEIAQLGEREYGVPLAKGGLHAGEWETSLMLAIHPELVSMEDAEAGFTGDLQEAVASMFAGGVASISENGAIGDPSDSSSEHGRRYWSAVVDLVLEQVTDQTSNE